MKPLVDARDMTLAPNDELGRWCLVIGAKRSPHLLIRLLQKIIVPEIDVLVVQFALCGSDEARAEVQFLARAKAADFALVRLRKLRAVYEAKLTHGDDRDAE